MAELTPMKMQYQQIKAQYGDCLLFFRLGDFYEMFDEDAKIASKELDLALTTRDRGVADPELRTPMCGVPYHSSQSYIAKLIARGYKVAICEQIEDPATAKGLVKRDVIRVITPGTVTDAAMLDDGKSNYLGSVYYEAGHGAVAFCDISTGEFCVAAMQGDNLNHILNELGRFAPRELIMNKAAAETGTIPDFARMKLGCMLEMGGNDYEYMECSARVCEQFKLSSIDEAGLGDAPAAVCAAGALLRYISETQKTDMAHIRRIDLFTGGRYMELDWATRRSLELTESLRTGEKRGSLLWVLDKTKTPMGGRLLRSWVERPLLSPVAIKRRLSAVDELCRNNVARGELIETMRGMGDMQRLIGRVVYGTANARDLVVLRDCTAVLPRIVELLAPFKSAQLKQIAELDVLEEINRRINWAICDDPPFSVREGGMLRTGYSEQVDKLRKIRDNGAESVAELEREEKLRTGIKKLKIGYNKVFGYYIEIPKSAAAEGKLPESYVRKQTLMSSERYFTPELKDMETTLLTASDKIKQLEYEFFVDLCHTIAGMVAQVQATAEAVAQLDVFCSFADVAVRNDYCMPEIDASGELIIRDGRHPVVEQTLSDIAFVPNDTQLNCEGNRVAIVTGPNMAGKSTYMRQTALIALMAQMGSFVPAKSAVIGVIDRVFTRIGASDDLASGQSTFMLEMSEVANILQHATASSLLILDEIGRGTSTYDGMAIARAVLEYCADRKKLGAKTMFATHYHELSALEGSVEGVHNFSISAKKQGDTLVFLRKIVPGSADDSYGIEVAKLAGVPDRVISKAKTYLKQLEDSGAAPKVEKKQSEAQISLVDAGQDEIGRILRATDINSLTPLEALNLLSELQQKARG